MKLLFPGLIALATLNGASIPMDSTRGDRLFESQGCVQCHQLRGRGGKAAPDLGRVLDRSYTPALLAGTMWNHAPTMWTAIRQKGMPLPDLDKQGAADLFASFYSARYFEQEGDAGRGKRLFAAKSCERCHGISSSPNPAARPVNQWESLADPIALVGAMWNHSSTMWGELSQRRLPWPTLTSQDLSDLQVYLRNASQVKNTELSFRITVGDEGERLFAAKGCSACHAGKLSAEQLTLTGVAASLWNHASLLRTQPPKMTPEEMREVLSEYWARQFFEASGDAAHGRRLFNSKHCVQCHSGSGPGPQLSANAGSYNGMTMVAALWRHGPAMLDQMKQKHIAWPVFKAGEMADLMAWLNEGVRK